MIYLTGDTHIPIDIHKIAASQWSDQMNMSKDDYLIVCGDFGLHFNYRETGKSLPSCPEDNCWDKEELWWLNWLEERPFTTLFVDGNHENYDRLKKYPATEWNGGKVQMISDSVIHLMRGQVYQIDNRSIFTMGGARSHDRGPATGTEKRDVHIIWWKDELPLQKEYTEALKNLRAQNNKVDYIVTHEAPADYLYREGYSAYELPDFLLNIKETVDYKRWYCGHHHKDTGYGRVRILYDDIVQIGE